MPPPEPMNKLKKNARIAMIMPASIEEKSSPPKNPPETLISVAPIKRPNKDCSILPTTMSMMKMKKKLSRTPPAPLEALPRSACLAGGRWQRLSLNHTDHFIDACINGACKISLPELRNNRFFYYAFCNGIRQHALKTIADFYAHGSVLLCNQQHGAVIYTFPPQLPGIGNSNRILFDCLGLSRWNNQYCDLAAFLTSKAASFCSSCVASFAESVPVRSVMRDLRGGTATSALAKKAEKSSAMNASVLAQDRFIYSSLVYFRGAGALKSTLGAVEISFSFSTVKLGFTL